MEIGIREIGEEYDELPHRYDKWKSPDEHEELTLALRESEFIELKEQTLLEIGIPVDIVRTTLSIKNREFVLKDAPVIYCLEEIAASNWLEDGF